METVDTSLGGTGLPIDHAANLPRARSPEHQPPRPFTSPLVRCLLLALIQPFARRREIGGSGREEHASEIDLIKRAVHVGLPSVALDERRRTAGHLHWEYLVNLAGRHGVLALVARSLKQHGWDGVPLPVVPRLVEYRAALTARNLFMTRQLLDVLDLLGAHGIAALPYKGPLLAAYVYGDVGLRPFADLDVIVPECDVLRARELLEAGGYQSLSPRTDAERPGVLPHGYALALRSDGERVVVELHWRIAPSCPLTAEALLADVRPFPLLGSTVPCLSPEHLLLVLCVHGAKHAWERFEWVCSVGHLLARRPDLDWDQVAAEARALGARRSVALGVALAADATGAPVADEAMRALGARQIGSVARDIGEALLHAAPESVDTVTRYSRRLRVRPVNDRLRYLLHLRHPTEKDRAFVALPSRLSAMYVLVRPVRVVCEHAAKRRRDRRRDAVDGGPAARALARQLHHQRQKAAALQGREDDVRNALAVRWENLQRRLRQYDSQWDDPRLLEVGSGAHGILFGSRSARAVGVDPLAHEYAALFPGWQRTVPTVAGVGERLPFGDASFDVVICDNVVDHAAGPAEIVAEMARLLRPGGLLYFTVNVHHRVYAAAARAHRTWNAAGLRIEIGPFADHTFHLTPRQARALFDRLPLGIEEEATSMTEAMRQARKRRPWHPARLLASVFFKNARYEVIARRR